jgi:hypothetical protein
MRLPAGRNQAPLAQLGRAGGAANAGGDYVEQSAPDSRRAPCVDTSSNKSAALNMVCRMQSSRTSASSP